MKRREVNSKIINLSQSQVKGDKAYDNHDVINKVCKTNREEMGAIISREFNSTYDGTTNLKFELAIVGACLLLSLLIPISFYLRVIVGLTIAAILEFTIHKGWQFLFKDLVVKYRYKDEVEYKCKFKVGDYKPVLIGINDKDLVEVRDTGSKDKETNLKMSRLYIADKETIGEMLFRYLHDDPIDVQSVSNKIVNEIKRSYINMKIINAGSLDKLQKSGYFNKTKK